MEDHREGVEAGEDQGVAETGEEGEEEDDRLREKELVRPPHQGCDIFEIDALPEAAADLVWTPGVWIFACLTESAGFVVEHDRRACLRREEVDGLRDGTEEHLDHEDPAPVHVGLDEAADNWGDHRASDRGENHIGDGAVGCMSVTCCHM